MRCGPCEHVILRYLRVSLPTPLNVVHWLLVSVARSRQVCIYVVEALLIAIYLPEGKDVYIHIRPTLLPAATSFSCLYTTEPSATSV